MNRRSNLPPFDACTSTSSYPRPATAGSITASSAAMDASRVPQTKNGPKPIFYAVPLKLLKFNRIWDLAPLSRRQIARQFDRAVADADQTADAGADRLEQAPHLPFATLSQHHPVPAIGAPSGTFVRHLDALERSAPIGELDASRQFLKILFFN